MNGWPALVLLVGCGGGKRNGNDTPPRLTDTGWFTATTDPLACPDRFVATVPEGGETGWYWRDRPEVFTATVVRDAYAATLVDGPGNRLDSTLEWDDAGLSFTVVWDGWLSPTTDYTLTLSDCTGTQQVSFTTSVLGRDLTIDPEDLIGNTYLVDLQGADWVEPPLLGALVSQFLTAPVLIGVRLADDAQLDVIGSAGLVDPLGVVTQNLSAPSWEFPVADFSEQPFVDLAAESVVLPFNNGIEILDIGITDFVLQATLAVDGSALGGGVLSGLADTRNLGALFDDADNPDAVCTLAAAAGAECESCPDGELYCLSLRAIDVDAEQVPGLVLIDN